MKTAFIQVSFRKIALALLISFTTLSSIANEPVSGDPSNGGDSPVSLTSFNAELTKKVVGLEWSTDRETNANYFILQRSKDGKTFTEIAMIITGDDSHVRKTYQYTDDRSLRGGNAVYYRLKIVDRDGLYVYSAVKTITKEKIAEINF